MKRFKKSSHRSAAQVAMMQRYGKTVTTYKDRRSPRKGARNRQRDYLSDNY